MAPGGHLGFMQITGVAQSCQSGNQAEFTRRGHVSTNQQKKLHRKGLTLGLTLISRTVSELSQLIVQISDVCVLEPPFGGLGTTYDVHLGLIGKRVLEFLLVLIKFFR